MSGVEKSAKLLSLSRQMSRPRFTSLDMTEFYLAFCYLKKTINSYQRIELVVRDKE